MRTAPLLFLLAASPLLAQQADLHVTLDAPQSVGANVTHAVVATVENLGPDAATNVLFRLEYGSCSKRTILPLAKSEKSTLTCEQTFANPQPAAGATAAADSELDDPNTSDNGATAIVRVITPPILEPIAFVNRVLDPGLPCTLKVRVINVAFVDAHDVAVTIQIDGVTQWTNLPDSCVAAGAQVRCVIGDVAGRRSLEDHPSINFELGALAPDDGSGRALRIETVASDRDGNTGRGSFDAAMYRVFYVTRSEDSGPGSLREAIEATTRAGCSSSSRCKISFRIPSATTPWTTIRPEAPLPLIRETIIDGRIQTQFFSDTNPDGPEIEINGDHARQLGGAGLAFESGQLYGVAVNGFSGPGILVRRGAWIEGNYIGCDPTGTRALPNERGIVLDTPTGTMQVQDNVISGNRRSGIFAYAGRDVRVYSNRIGWNAKGDGPLPNGASGVFIGPDADGAFVNGNSIAFNAHMGISVAGGVRLVEMSRNALYANGGLGIDYRLDGVSPTVEGPTSKVFESPRITSARYDPISDTTVIEGFQPAPPDGFASRSVTLYANDVPDSSGFGEGQVLLGEFSFADFTSSGNPAFAVTLKGRPPGRWISATVTVALHYYFSRTPGANGDNQGLLTTTTEFGRTVPVEGF